ncbi:MAG TPA: cyclic nucleotide-binding domain-containing protein [Candidatus Methylomirabilis sp.]|nr:cyclic nucleotide-binding domain-containing protein [Candidatus Methylomirabilis sp.]
MQTLDALLADHPFFQGLPSEDLALIAGCGSNAHFDAGSYLFHEGDASNRFYLIRHGRIALEISAPGRDRMTIATLGPGEVLGWSWLVPPYRKQSDARALEAVRATAFDGACIRAKCEADPRLGYELLKRFAAVIGQRLHATRLQLLDVYGASG